MSLLIAPSSDFAKIVLYAFFLNKVLSAPIPIKEGESFFFDSWMMAGIVAAATVTACLGGYGTMVADEENKIDRDFRVSPLKDSNIIGSSLLSGLCVSFIMTMLTLIAAMLYIVLNGGEMVSAMSLLKIMGIVLLTLFSSNAIVCFIVTFVHKIQTFASVSILFGSMIGFFVGAYIPIGILPEGVQYFLTFIPCTHAAVLLRKVMTAPAIDIAFPNVSEEHLMDFYNTLGIILKVGDYEFTNSVHIIILAGSAIVFTGLSILRLKHNRRKTGK